MYNIRHNILRYFNLFMNIILIDEQQITYEIRELNIKKTYYISKYVNFRKINSQVHTIIKHSRLLPLDIENIICDYTNEQYDINYQIYSDISKKTITITSHDDLIFECIISHTQYCRNSIEITKNNFIKSIPHYNYTFFIDYYMNTHYNTLREYEFEFHEHIIEDAYFNDTGITIQILDSDKFLYFITIIKIISDIIFNK